MIALTLAFCLVLAADLISKSIVVARMREGASSNALLGIRFTHVMNRRTPWKSGLAIRILSAFLLCLAAGAVFAAAALHSMKIDVAVGALIGGAAGNLVDGFKRRGVTDFIDLRVWPVFNLADAAIVAGAAWIFWDLASLVLVNRAIS
jgi:signal peptidase II